MKDNYKLKDKKSMNIVEYVINEFKDKKDMDIVKYVINEFREDKIELCCRFGGMSLVALMMEYSYYLYLIY